MTEKKRRFILAGLLLLTVLATIFAPGDKKTDVVTPVARKQPARSAQVEHTPIDLPDLKPRELGHDVMPFVQQAWIKKPHGDVAQIPVIETVPVAPTVPFKIIGKYIEDGKVMVFLSMNDRNFVARQGDTIEDAYRVEKITEVEMILTYLPLGKKQNILLESVN